ILAAPLYLLARFVPGVGLVHTVYLFNVLVGAAAALLFLPLALVGRASGRAALLAALGSGGGTIIFPYPQTFCREPLVLLMLLTAALLAERLRASRYRSLPLLAVLVVAVIALLLAKASALLALPALLVIALPDARAVHWRRVLIVLVVIVGAAALLFLALA